MKIIIKNYSQSLDCNIEGEKKEVKKGRMLLLSDMFQSMVTFLYLPFYSPSILNII